MDDKLKELEQKIGYTFRDSDLLKTAMMHSSYTNEPAYAETPLQ